MPVIQLENFNSYDLNSNSINVAASLFENMKKKAPEDKKALYEEFWKYIESIQFLKNANNDEKRKEYLNILNGFKDFLYKKDEKGVTNWQLLVESDKTGMLETVKMNLQNAIDTLELGINFEELEENFVKVQNNNINNIINDNIIAEKEDFPAHEQEDKNNEQIIEKRESAIDYIEKIRDNKFKVFNPHNVPVGEREQFMEEFKDNVLHIMAARMLANSDRGKADKLKKTSFTNKQVDDLVRRMKEHDCFKKFLREITLDTDMYKKAFVAASIKPGHGGKLDDMFKEFLLNIGPGSLSNDALLGRYMPTVKERIESIQKLVRNYPDLNKELEDVTNRLRDFQEKGEGDENLIADLINRKTLLQERVEDCGNSERACGEIIVLRNMVKAERGNKSRLNVKIPVAEEDTLWRQASYFSADDKATELGRSEDMLALLQNGHGGEMMRKFRDECNDEMDEDVVKTINGNSIQTYKEEVCNRAEQHADRLDNAQGNELPEMIKEGKLLIHEYLILVSKTWNPNLNTTTANKFLDDVPWSEIDELHEKGVNYDKKVIATMKNFTADDVKKCLKDIKNNSAEGFVKNFENLKKEADLRPIHAPEAEQLKAPKNGMHR